MCEECSYFEDKLYTANKRISELEGELEDANIEIRNLKEREEWRDE